MIRSFIILFVFCTFIYSCEYTPPDPYSRSVNKVRLSKDSLLKWHMESPFGHEDRIDFVELKYYAPDSTYKVQATLEKFETQDTILIQNSIGRNEKYFRFGKLKFNLKEKQNELVVYQQHKLLKEGRNLNHLFLPFWDATNGKETYEGGRYIDLEYNGKNILELDFNFAYSPYCAYSEEYTCPIPPEENRLPFEVKAGEKIYKK